jgi:hypothetical protein
MNVPAYGQAPHPKFAPPVTYDPGPAADSVAIADLRGDGKLDLVVANYCQEPGPDSCDGYGQVAVLLGNGDGTFQPAVFYSTGAYGAESVAVADMNGDGIPDLVVANSCGTQGQFGCNNQLGAASVLLGNGDGSFQPAVNYSSAGDWSFSVAIQDLNGDGIPDLVVSNGGAEGFWDGTVSVLLGNGNGTFQPAVNYSSGGQVAASVAIGDLSGDGIPDLVVANYGNSWVAVLLGNGDGTFQPAVTYGSNGPSSVALGDLRGNGILDVAVATGFNPGKRPRSSLGVLLGNGDGTLQTVVSYPADGVGLPSSPAVGSGINSLVIADVNGDGIPDAVAAEPCQSLKHYTDCVGNKDVSVLLGNGDGTLQAPVAYSSGGFLAWGIAVADVNGDGRPDLVVVNQYASEGAYDGTVAVLLNETSYASKTALTSSPNPSQVNQTVTFTATITPTPPNGELVTFYNGKTELGTGATTNGVATLTASFSEAKTYTIKSTYPGDPFRKPSSATVKQVVNP